VDPQLLTALTTEHFALQGQRSATISDSSSRASLYLTMLTGSLVALGFVGDPGSDAFLVFALAVLPAVALLGFITFVRVLEDALEDVVLLFAVSRIRRVYAELAGDRADELFLLGTGPPTATMRDAGIWAGPRQLWFTTASTIGSVNSLVLGTVLAILLAGVLDLPLGIGAAAGVAAALALAVLHTRVQRRRFAGVLARYGREAVTAAAGPRAPSPA
jgi:hypothetical protein